MTRAMGWLPDEPDHRDVQFGLTAGRSPVPAAASMREHVDFILDQGNIQSCVANAIAYAVHVGQKKNDVEDPEMLSRLFVYYVSRNYLGPQAAMTDSGSMLRLGMKVLNKLGFCPEAVWPYDESRVTTRPPWLAFTAAADQALNLFVEGAKPIGYYSIAREDRVAEVKRAVALGYPVVFGTGVSSEFADDPGTKVLGIPPANDVQGGHAMCILEYETLPSGLVVFRGPNSYGSSWGDEGWFAFTADVIAWEGSRDFWATKLAPCYSLKAAA